MTEWSAGQLAYIDQRTRQLLVVWAEHCIRNPKSGSPDMDSLPSVEEIKEWAAEMPGLHPALVECRKLEMHRVYFDHALKQGWLTKKVDKDGRRQLTATGWKTAAAFLKR